MTERIYYVIRRMGPQGIETRLTPGQGYGLGKLTEKTGAGAFTSEEMCKILPTLKAAGPYSDQFAVPIRVKKVPALWEAVVTDCKAYSWAVGQTDVGTKKSCESRAQDIRETRPCCTVEVRRVKRA